MEVTTMRDPGTSRSNPLFARESVDDAHDDDDAPEPGAGSDWARLDELFASGSAAEAVVASMLEAGPEAVEHLMNAGQELLLAAKALLDAAERGLEEHRRADAGETPANVRRLDLG
jgi:hypothetical protein